MTRTILCMVVLIAGTTAVAAPPGALDGQNIPTDYALSTELATQTNRTGFGNQVLGTGAYSPGSEVDGLHLAIDGTYLWVGVTGNLEQNGHSYVIFIDQEFVVTGQTELRSEGVEGPPFTVQTASREIVVSTNGTTNGADDTWAYGSNGTILPCEADYALAVDVFGGTMSASEYRLVDPTGPAVGTHDPTPDNPGDPLLNLYAQRTWVAQGPVNDGNDIFENQTALGYEFGGFNNTNTSGVTWNDASNADAATSGLEIAIPLANVGIGLLPSVDTINIFVALVDGGGSTGTIVNQTLPAITDVGTSGPCDPPAAIGLRQDLTPIASCRFVDLSTLPTFTGTAEGIIHPAEYGAVAPLESQTCPTPYGDQDWDPNASTTSGGSELNVMWADNDDQFLYLGITGNVEPGGNTLQLFIDVTSNGGPVGSHVATAMDYVPFQALKGLAGDEYPNGPLPGDAALTYEYAYGINLDGGSPTTWVDFWDLVNSNGDYRGSSQRESGDGTLSGGNNPNGMIVALNDLNEDGVEGGFGDCGGDTSSNALDVALTARSATLGFEIAIPLADIGLDSVAFPHGVYLWAYITGSGPDAWGSNQSLPSMRNVTGNGEEVENVTMDVTNYTDPLNGAVDCRNFEARAAKYTLVGASCAGVEVPAGDDSFATPCGATGYDFVASPLPADFFGPGSDPFTGAVGLGGAGGGFSADTTVRRLADMCFDQALPETEVIDAEIVALDLVSCAPITVTYGGLNPELWDVDVDLSPTPAPVGSLSATKTHANGGTFDSLLPVLPRFTFTMVDPPNTVKVLDFGAVPLPATDMGAVGVPWLHEDAGVSPHCPGNFCPGVDEVGGLPCCPPESCHEGPSPGHLHCVYPPECEPCTYNCPWGLDFQINQTCPDSDVNCDGNINALDIAVVVSGLNWFKTVGDADNARADVDRLGNVAALDIAPIVSGLCWFQ
ncbi:MAG: hypothetical protein GY842_08945 [bacterium]|nr:hypothetical protein [bacterium]